MDKENLVARSGCGLSLPDLTGIYFFHKLCKTVFAFQHSNSQESNGGTSAFTIGGGLPMTSTPTNSVLPPNNVIPYHSHNGSGSSNHNSTQITSHHLNLVQSVTVAPLGTAANGPAPIHTSAPVMYEHSPKTSGDLSNVPANPQNQLTNNIMQQLTQEIEKER